MNILKSLTFAFLIMLGTSLSAQTKKINTATSKITWLAKKIGGQHSGTVNLKEGALVFKNKNLAGGSFIVDMTSLTATDLSGEYQTKLNNHLKAEDFFNTAKFNTASLKFTKIVSKGNGNYTVVANLTIKGITNPITFNLATTAKSASTTLMIDRTKYDIKYASKSFFESIGDKAIDDEFELKVNLQF